MTPLPCNWCDLPASGHGVRYAAMIGDHEWTPGEPPREPEPVPHWLGGITYPVDPTRTAQWWEDTDPDPAPPPGGGDRLPSRKATR